MQFDRKLGGWPYYAWKLQRSWLPSYALWMSLAGVVVLVCGSAFMLGPESEFDSERLTQFRRLQSLPGPHGRWRAAEDSSAALGQTLSSKFCENVLEDQTMLDNWFGGAQLICTEEPPSRGFAGLSVSTYGPRESQEGIGQVGFPGGSSLVRRRCVPAGSPRLPFSREGEGR